MYILIKSKTELHIKLGYCLERLTPETMKTVGSTKNKITIDKNGENAPHLENTKVI